MAKAVHCSQVKKFEDIPNIGKSIANDLRLIGVNSPDDLKDLDPYDLYSKLCSFTETYHDPCVLDIFLSAKAFMAGGNPETWWKFTEERKNNFEKVKDQVERYR